MTERHTATPLLDGRVLVTGGVDPQARANFVAGGPRPPSAELYDPESETFTATDKMTVDWSDAKEVLLPNGKVLVVYGNALRNTYSPVPDHQRWLYDPAGGTFTITRPMLLPRSDLFSATGLQDGKVLVAGGHYQGILASAELYEL